MPPLPRLRRGERQGHLYRSSDLMRHDAIDAVFPREHSSFEGERKGENPCDGWTKMRKEVNVEGENMERGEKVQYSGCDRS